MNRNMISDDFSFPRITNPLPHFAISPSLWRVSSVVYPDFYDEDDGGGGGGELAGPSSFLKDNEDVVKRESSSSHDEEKMDMLWEDFNEELERVSSLSSKQIQKQSLSSNCYNTLDINVGETTGGDGDEQLELCCAQQQALKISKPVVYHQPKKQSFVLIVKVLKKIFLLHRSTQLKN